MILEVEASSAQIQRILQSKAFRTSEVHRNLLNYLAEKSLSGDAENVKEYTVGLDVFSKPSSYDPRQESTVRMHVARLRQKLSEYYRTEGVDDPIIVDLPKGGFRVTFEPRPVGPEPVAAVAAPVVIDRRHYWFEFGLAVALVLAIGLALYFGTRLRQVQQAFTQTTEWTPELRELWEPLISANRPLILAVSTSRPGSGVGPASGLVRLGEFLGIRRANVQVLASDQIEAPEVAMGNVVFLGSVTNNRQMQAMFAGRPLMLEADGIHNVQPQPGEPALIADHPQADPQDTEESYALISRVPGLYGNGEVLYLSGNRPASITGGVNFFTDPDHAKTLVEKLRGANGILPKYYQVVLRVRSMDDMPIEVSYLLHRQILTTTAVPSAK
jgi:hypothetical protein